MEIQPIFSGVVHPRPSAGPRRTGTGRESLPPCVVRRACRVEMPWNRSPPGRRRAARSVIRAGAGRGGAAGVRSASARRHPARPIRPAAGPARALPTGSYILWRAEKSVAEVSVSEGGLWSRAGQAGAYFLPHFWNRPMRWQRQLAPHRLQRQLEL